MLRLQHLDIGYEAKVVQHDLCPTASAGQMICMLGKNGCGKSTLLRTLAGLQPALAGTITIQDKTGAERDLYSLKAVERAELLSLVLTERVSMNETQVFDIVAMGRYPYINFLGGLTGEDRQVVTNSLQAVGLLHKQGDYFNSLSDGEKQRVLIAKALAQQTPIILLDEPTAHLDLPNRIKTLLLLRQLAHEEKKTIIISTHELDLALQTADMIWLMRDREGGIEEGTPSALMQSGAFSDVFSDNTFTLTTVDNHLQIRLI